MNRKDSSTSFLLTNARIYTKMLPTPTSLLVVDGRVAWLGKADQLDQFGDVLRIDCEGHWLAPAFADAHVHVTNTGLELTGLNLKNCCSADEMSAKLLACLKPDASVVIGHGWDDSGWSRQPNLNDIDVSIPVYLSRVDVHSAVINNALIARCPEITTLSGWDGTGRVTQDAHALARKTAFALLTDADRDLARQTALSECARQGIVAVDEMAGPIVSSEQDALAVRALGDERVFPEVFVWWGELFGYETAQRVGAVGCGGDLFVDGSLGSKTACITEEYIGGGHGVQYISEEAVAHHIELAMSFQMPTGFHAIGDLAIESVFQGFAACATRHGADAFRRLSHRVEHAEMTTPSQFATASSLNIGLSVQPQFDALWAGHEGMYDQRIGNRHTTMNNFAAMAQAGAPVLFGSDAPVTSLNPWLSILAATSTHQPEHSQSLRLAFANHTRSFWRHRGHTDVGVIEVGNIASFALWQVPVFEENESGVAQAEHTMKWSLDPRSGFTSLPNIREGLPHALQVWKYGMPMLRHTIGSLV